jgi:hypothetical protein
VRVLLEQLEQYANFSRLVGGSNGTTTVFGDSTSGGNGTVTTSPTPSLTYTGPSANFAGFAGVRWVAVTLGLVVAVALYIWVV